MTTRAADGHDVRQALHRAVRDLFEQNGYAGTHIRDITDRAGVALSTFYATYGSKKQAWHATMGSADETTDSAGAARSRGPNAGGADRRGSRRHRARRLSCRADHRHRRSGGSRHRVVLPPLFRQASGFHRGLARTSRHAAQHRRRRWRRRAAIPTTRSCGQPPNCVHTPSSASMLPSIAIWTTTPVTHHCYCYASTRPLEPTPNSSSCALRYTAISPQRSRPVCAAGKQQALPT